MPTESLPGLHEDDHGVIPAPARGIMPNLYETETNLVAYYDGEPTPEQEAEFKADLAEALRVAVKKRDASAGFILQCENLAEFAAQEIRRLQARKNVFINWADRHRAYVCSIIEQLPPDAKGKPAKLEGERFRMSVRAVPASLEITDAKAVPLTYKTVTVTMPAVAYEVLKATFGMGGVEIPAKVAATLTDEERRLVIEPFDFAKLPAHYSIDNAAVKAALQAGNNIPGADLRVGGMTLVVK
jgi:hypothetical protein